MSFTIVRGKYGTRAYCPTCRYTVPDTPNGKSDHAAAAHGLGNGIRGWNHAQAEALAKARARRRQALAETTEIDAQPERTQP